MTAEEFDIAMNDGALVHAYRWQPELRATAVVQIAHGMAEHSGRYSRLAGVLVEQGYEVWSHDHRGHGKTASEHSALGHFPGKRGFHQVVADVLAVRTAIDTHERSGDKQRVALFAHSMGSFAAQAALVLHPPSPWDAVILAGSDAPRGRGVLALRGVAVLERLRQGDNGQSALIDALAFGPYNSGFRPNRTKSDWLSRDSDEVDAFIADPLTGFRLTNQSWVDFLGVRASVGRAGFVNVEPKLLPVLLMAGDRDPVGRNGAGVRDLEDQLRRGGMSKVEVILYPHARHELINELNRDEVYRDTLAFLHRTLT